MLQSFFTDRFYAGNTFVQYGSALLVILGTLFLGKLFYKISRTIFRRYALKTQDDFDDIIVNIVEKPILFAFLLAGIWYGFSFLSLSVSFEKWVTLILKFFIVFNIAWLLSRLLDAIIKKIILPRVKDSASDFDDQLLPMIEKGLKIAIWLIAIIFIINAAGYNVTSLVAGLGIGGLAFALAAQNYLSNLFGGFTIFLDKPFIVDDRIKISGYDGFVTDIGLRSTRLKTLEGREVTIPNATFTDQAVENVSREPNRKVILKIGLVYDAGADGVELGIKLLKEIIKKNKNTEPQNLVSFDEFGDSSLNITFIYYIRKKSDLMETPTEINLAILREFTENKLEFAFPTQTIYTIK
ncbi:MAG: mechanosensitive ion channel family protein [Alphaproteobacteria bacterium]